MFLHLGNNTDDLKQVPTEAILGVTGFMNNVDLL